MKNTLWIAALFLVGTAFLSSCGDGGDSPEPEKTVDRSKLTDKDWYDENGARAYHFASDGTYNYTEGTWEWYPTGDSIEINDNFFGKFNFYFDYITDTEMRAGTKSSRVTYTTSP
jgi:hypothetical protein